MILLVVLYALVILVSSGQDITNVYEEPFAADVRVFGCKSPEYVTINSGQGIIHCTFPPSFKAVFWYDDVLTTNTDLPVLRYDSMSGSKSGEGYIKGEYDVTTHGSLVIKKVTLEHEKSFKVICIEENDDVKVYTSSVVVLVESPASQSFIGTCSGPVCYQQSTETTQLNCFFNGTKPARHLLWQPKLAYSHIPSVQTEIVENANGTFNSIATLELTPSKNNLLSIWECKTYWIHPDDTRKIEIVVDFSDYDSFKSIYNEKNITTEIDKPQTLQCGHGYQLYLWKKVKNGTATFLGLHAFGSVIKNKLYNDISFTNAGDMVFSSVKITHEGLYICLYSEGTTIQIGSAYLEVLVPPTPPRVIIKGCERNVVCNVTTTSATLECSVFGVKPLVALTWSFDEKLPITLENHKETVSSHDGIFDITSKVDYLITRTTFCDEELVLRCLVNGPSSKYFRSVEYVNINLAKTCVDRTASSCEDEGKGTMLTTAVVLLTSTVIIETSMLVTLGVWKLCKGYKIFLGSEGDPYDGQSLTSFRMENLQLPCNTSFTQSSMWMKNKEVYLFVAGDPVAKLDDNVRLNSSNHALIFNGVGLKDEGNYTCKVGGSVVITYFLKVHGHPNVSLTFQNGNIIEGSVYVLHDSHHVITCTAEGLGITKTSLETRSMFTLLEKSRDGTNIVSNKVTSNGSQVIINLQATAVLTLIECNVFGDYSILAVSHAEILTVVVPNVTMTINSRPIWTVIEMQRSRTYTLSCHAIGARPAVKLYWLVDGSLTFISENHFKSKSNGRSTGLLDRRSDIQISLDGPEGRISCVCEGNTSLQSKVVTADILPDENESASTAVNVLPFMFTIITIACIVVVAVVIYVLRNHATPLNLRSRQLLRGEVGTINKSGTKDDIQDDPVSHSLKDSEEGVRLQHGQQQRKHEHIQSMVLPAIPQEAAETIQVYYSRPKDSLQMTRIFTKREVCFVAQLKKGLFLTRWLGTIEESKGKKKCVFVSILNEDKDMKTEFQWDVFLQKLMELPKHMNVVEAEGILTDRENIYLLQEYIPVGSLHENLVIHGNDYRGNNAEFASSELFDIGLQILKGMEFIVTYGFLHPGISTRRILFTENGCCKLYDFCLKEDARKHVICIKGKDIRSPLPPEAEARNEYTWASDSWSVAMCVLKLMTFDSSGTEEAMAPETLIKCPSYVQNCFKNCQSEDPHDRPPLSDLRQALSNWKEEVQLITSHVEAIGVTTSSKGRQDDDGYIIMEGNVRSEEN